MWHAVSPVDKNYKPIIYEGDPSAIAVVLNAGPGSVLLEAWTTPRPPTDKRAEIRVEMRSGNMRSVRGSLIRCGIIEDAKFSAIAWRLIV